jgi:hypothetical protein
VARGGCPAGRCPLGQVGRMVNRAVATKQLPAVLLTGATKLPDHWRTCVCAASVAYRPAVEPVRRAPAARPHHHPLGCHRQRSQHVPPVVRGGASFSHHDRCSPTHRRPFATTSGIVRVGGNKKDVLTRDRQPKSAAHALRRRWRNELHAFGGEQGSSVHSPVSREGGLVGLPFAHPGKEARMAWAVLARRSAG